MSEKIIPCFYLRKSQVPFPQRFFGEIACFLPFCPRQGSKGFKTMEDMRMHARTRHRMEYQAHMETIAANKADELDVLRARLDRLMDSRPEQPEQWEVPPSEVSRKKPYFTPEQRAAAAMRMRQVHAKKKLEREQNNHPVETT